MKFRLNNIAKKRNCFAVSVGTSLFIDSKNVIDDLKELKKNIDYPILHPLIAMNKDEIIEKCKDIGLGL